MIYQKKYNDKFNLFNDYPEYKYLPAMAQEHNVAADFFTYQDNFSYNENNRGDLCDSYLDGVYFAVCRDDDKLNELCHNRELQKRIIDEQIGEIGYSNTMYRAIPLNKLDKTSSEFRAYADCMLAINEMEIIKLVFAECLLVAPEKISNAYISNFYNSLQNRRRNYLSNGGRIAEQNLTRIMVRKCYDEYKNGIHEKHFFRNHHSVDRSYFFKHGIDVTQKIIPAKQYAYIKTRWDEFPDFVMWYEKKGYACSEWGGTLESDDNRGKKDLHRVQFPSSMKSIFYKWQQDFIAEDEKWKIEELSELNPDYELCTIDVSDFVYDHFTDLCRENNIKLAFNDGSFGPINDTRTIKFVYSQLDHGKIRQIVEKLKNIMDQISFIPGDLEHFGKQGLEKIEENERQKQIKEYKKCAKKREKELNINARLEKRGKQPKYMTDEQIANQNVTHTRGLLDM